MAFSSSTYGVQIEAAIPNRRASRRGSKQPGGPTRPEAVARLERLKSTVRVIVDCRYVRERPSGIGAYVRALLDRLPTPPGREYLLWAHPRALRPLNTSPAVRETVIAAGPSSPLSILWPDRYASFDGVALFHSPHNILPRRIPCPSIVTVHDVLALDWPALHRPGIERIRGLYYPQAVMRALQQATRIIVPTVATADRVLAWAPDATTRLRVIRHAPGAPFRPAVDGMAAHAAAVSLVGSDQPYILVVGENSPNKSHEVALAAFAAAAPPHWRLVLVQRLGSPHLLRRLAERAGIAPRVVWLKGLSDVEVATLMQSASALLQPSRYEGFGLPVVEAMASGCPVIASDIAPLREVTGGAALLVPPGDTGAFGAALRRLVESPDARRALIDAGREQSQQFSWDRTASETFALYDEVMNGSGALTPLSTS